MAAHGGTRCRPPYPLPRFPTAAPLCVCLRVPAFRAAGPLFAPKGEYPNNMNHPEKPLPLLRRALRLPGLLLQLAAFALPAFAQTVQTIDNTSGAFQPTGTFSTATSPSGFQGSNYFHDNNTNKGNLSANYRPTLSAGYYEVSVRWPQSGTHSTSVPVEIFHRGGTSVVYVNQQVAGGAWNTVGTYEFASGTSGYVRIQNANTSGRVVWDAVRFTPVTPTQVIVDNPQATASGPWAINSTGYPNDRYGSDYLNDTAKSPVATATYTPNIPSDGLYDVYVRWTSHANRATNTPVLVHSAEGVEKFFLNQTSGGGAWHRLGSFMMRSGTQSKVVISNEGTASGTIVIADAVRFVKSTSVERIVDNTDATSVVRTGNWVTSTGVSGYYGTNYLHDDNAGQGTKSVKFIPDLPEAGTYEVFMRWTVAGSGRASNTQVIVDWAGGVTTDSVNQQANGTSWYSLGTYNFVHGRVGSVTITNTDANGHVIADAVRFVRTPKLFAPEDLGDRRWYEWRSEDLPNGSVSSWASRIGGLTATQSTSSRRPEKINGEVRFAANGNKQLTFPKLDNAYMDIHGLVILFRIDLSGSGDGFVFSVNGVGGGNERQPSLTYDRPSNKLNVAWKTDGNHNIISFVVPEEPSAWNVLVSRRVGRYHYASLNGRDTDGNLGESVRELADWAVPPTSGNNGVIGDIRSTNPTMAIDSIVLTHGPMTSHEAQRLAGWALWKKSAQSRLPSNHPYRQTAPYVRATNYHFVESTPAEWSTLVARLTNYNDRTPGSARSHLGDPVNTAGWSLVFNEEFSQHTVTNQVRGKGNWFAPGHGQATGVARAIEPPLNTSNAAIGKEGTPATYIHTAASPGYMSIKMQRDPADTSKWTSGAFASVNNNGVGRSWMYPYVVARMRMGFSSTNNKKGAWPALWLKSANFYHNRTETNLEFDAYEGYISDRSDNYHYSVHNWGARGRKMPGRFPEKNRGQSHIKSMSPPYWSSVEELFDGQWHTYAAMVTDESVKLYFDGKEVGRFPTPMEFHQPLWILADLAMKEEEVAGADGDYQLDIDYIKVYQRQDLPGYAPNTPVGPIVP